MPRQTLHRIIHHWASEAPTKPAVIYDGGELDYLTFSDEVCSVAAALALRLDLGSIVLLRFPVIPEAFVSFYGCAEAGMLPLIIGGDFFPSHLKTLVEKTGAKALMLDDKADDFETFIEIAASLELKVFYCGDTKINISNCISLREAVTIGNPAYRGPINSGVNPLYAAKYTGSDEYATISHENALIPTKAYDDYFRLPPDGQYLAIRSRKIPFHEFSALPIIKGNPIIIMKDRQPATVYDTINRYGVCILQVDDTYIAELSEYRRERPQSLQHIIWYRSIYDGPPQDVYRDIWGVPVTRYTGCFASSGAGFKTFGDAPAEMMGTTMPYVKAEIMDDNGEPVNVGVPGSLEISGPSISTPRLRSTLVEDEVYRTFATGIKAIEAPRNFYLYC